MSKYENLSDDAFVSLLHAKLHDASWNVGEIVELERRGIEIVGKESELSVELLKKRSEFSAAINKALEPYSKNFAILTRSLNNFKDLHLRTELASNPWIETRLISTPETAEDLVSNEIANVMKLSLSELRSIRRQNDRDWFQWTIWISTLLAALTGLCSLIFR